jgi:hypothetical protein
MPIKDRFSRLTDMAGEASTWAGLAAIALAVGQVFPEFTPITAKLAVLAGSIAAIIKEKSA